MKLWQKEYDLNDKIAAFTIGQDNELDLQLAAYDVQGSMAHIRMLQTIGLLEADELEQLLAALGRILEQIEASNFTIEAGVEDIHSQVELLLTRELGDLGKKIHAGRSRNDQVLVDLRLFFRAEIKAINALAHDLFELLQAKSEEFKEVLLPGYTHTQVAMVSSFGLWFGAYAEALVDDLQMLQGAYKVINQNPLGSAAGYGSSFPLNRKMTTDLLEFDDLAYNVVYAQMGRGKSELFLSYGIAALASTLGKLAADICLYNSQNFAFLKLPNEFTTGSSIMPHKKNPDVFELIRGNCNVLTSLPIQITSLTNSLTSGYHRDFQLLKETLFPAIQKLKACLDIATYALQSIEVRRDILEEEKYKYLYTVEVVNAEVLNGLPFRDAYKKVGEQVEAGQFKFSGDIQHTHEGSLGNLCTAQIAEKMKRVQEQW
ncbi:MAG: argininosuccinate lyase [Bacteroidota bacterium]